MALAWLTKESFSLWDGLVQAEYTADGRLSEFGQGHVGIRPGSHQNSARATSGTVGQIGFDHWSGCPLCRIPTLLQE